MSFPCLFHISISALNCASRNAIRVYDRLLCLLPSIYGKCTTRGVLWVCCCFIFPLQSQRSNLDFQIKAVFSVWYDCLLVRMLSAIKALTKVNEVHSLTHILKYVQFKALPAVHVCAAGLYVLSHQFVSKKQAV